MAWFSASSEQSERAAANLAADFEAAEQASEERSARFWQEYEQINGPGSIDRSRPTTPI